MNMIMTSHPFYFFFSYIDFVEASYRYKNSIHTLKKSQKKIVMCMKLFIFRYMTEVFLSYCFSMASDYNYNNPKKKKKRIFVCLAMERGIKFIIMSFVDVIFLFFVLFLARRFC